MSIVVNVAVAGRVRQAPLRRDAQAARETAKAELVQLDSSRHRAPRPVEKVSDVTTLENCFFRFSFPPTIFGGSRYVVVLVNEQHIVVDDLYINERCRYLEEIFLSFLVPSHHFGRFKICGCVCQRKGYSLVHSLLMSMTHERLF